ncbi:hypothetical protein Tco_0615726 [Tanacetum coccineum]
MELLVLYYNACMRLPCEEEENPDRNYKGCVDKKPKTPHSGCRPTVGLQPESEKGKRINKHVGYNTRVCIGILACRGLSLISSTLHAMKSQFQIPSSAAVKFGGVTVSNYEASQRNFVVIYHLLLLKFSNLSTSLLDREKVHLDDSRFPQFAPRDVPDLSYESFLLSQSLEVGQKDHHERAKELVKLLELPNEFEELE